MYNREVNQQLTNHYKYLHTLLVITESDEAIFNDTYLKLTYNYDSSKDFREQFKYYFNLLKGAYYRDNLVENYVVQTIEDRAVPDTIQPIEEEEPKKKDKPSISDLKNKVQAYALSKKEYKRASKKD